MENPYRPFEAKLLDVIEESHNIRTFVLEPEKKFRFATGQFVELSLPGVGEAPFTPSSDPEKAEKFDISVMKVGRTTKALHETQKGMSLGVRGPYGKGYPLDDFNGKNLVIAGGGVGLAPLRSLVLAMFHRLDTIEKLVLRFGARSPQDMIYKDEVASWGTKDPKVDLALTVDKADDSWNHNEGVVTTILNDVPVENSIAVVCGPPIMMKFATFKLLELGFKDHDIYLSMEKNMSCGFGKCGHCRLGPYYVCEDGPVFTYDKIKEYKEIWD